MSNKHQRYEAVVLLDNKAVVQYHNINTGLKKFQRFVKKKFQTNYIKYTARRISTKEIIGTFYNERTIQIKATRVYLPKQRNNKNSGFFVRFPFKRYEALINRNLFFSDKIVLNFEEEFLIIPDDIFEKAVSNAIEELKAYFLLQGQTVAYDEIILGEFKAEKILFTKKISDGTEPMEDYP